MSYQKYLSKTCRLLPHQGYQRGARSWLATLVIILWVWLIASATQAETIATDSCEPRILNIESIRTGQTEPTSLLTAQQYPASAWQAVSLPDRWQDRWPSYTGAVWYRIDWQTNCHKQATTTQTTPIAVSIDSLSMAGEIYLNNDLLWQDKNLQEPLSRSWNMPRLWTVPTSAIHEQHNTLWVQVIGTITHSPGLGNVVIATQENATSHHHYQFFHKRTLVLINLVITLSLSLPAFFIWLIHPKASAFGWYALSGFAWLIVGYDSLSIQTWPFSQSLISARLSVTALILFSCSFCLFCLRFIEKTFPRLELIGWLLSLSSALSLLFFNDLWLVISFPIAFVWMLFIVSVTFLYFQWVAWRSKQRHIKLMAAVLFIYLCLSIHDFALMMKLIRHDIALTPYAMPITIMAIAIIIAGHIVSGMRRIEYFSQALKKRVKKASSELTQSLATQHQLELTNTKLQERVQLTHDLHDGFGSSLVRSIALIEQSEPSPENQRFLSVLRQLRDDLRQIIDTNMSSHNHTPNSPQQCVARVRRRFHQLFDEMDIALTWSFPETWEVSPDNARCLCLVRLLEESLTNVIKHSQATEVMVMFDQQTDGVMMLTVEDNGIGFDTQTAIDTELGRGIGMNSMRSRVQRIGGTLSIKSIKGKTTIYAEW